MNVSAQKAWELQQASLNVLWLLGLLAVWGHNGGVKVYLLGGVVKTAKHWFPSPLVIVCRGLVMSGLPELVSDVKPDYSRSQKAGI